MTGPDVPIVGPEAEPEPGKSGLLDCAIRDWAFLKKGAMLFQFQPVFPSVVRASYSALLASVHSMAFVELQPPRTFPLAGSVRTGASAVTKTSTYRGWLIDWPAAKVWGVV